MDRKTEELKTYCVTLAPKEELDHDDVLKCTIRTIQCEVMAENFVNACIYAQAYFSEKLDTDFVVQSGFSYSTYCPEVIIPDEEALDGPEEMV